MTMIKSRRKLSLFDIFNSLLMLVIMMLTLYPFWYVLVGSFSSIAHIVRDGFILLPDGLHLDAYAQVFRNNLVPVAYRNTILITLTGTVISMTLTILGAYVLSLRDMPGHSFLTLFVVFTMLFSGGLIPTYLLVSKLGLIDSLWALILPGAVSAYNMVLMRNFFQAVPNDLFEAAQLDGIGHGRYLFQIVVPLSVSCIATITLFYAVGYWNAYFGGVIYIRTRSHMPMQTLLREILNTSQFNTIMYDDANQNVPAETLKDAMIVVTVLPILCVYPFIQKYFVKGIMTGSLKG